MTFSFTTITPKAEFRDFFYYVHEMEDGFNALNRIASGDDTLVKVVIIDNNKRTPLPIDAFDGKCFSEPIQQLKEEWQQILSQPINLRSIHNQRISIVIRRQHKRGEGQMARIKLAIGKIECYLNQIQGSTLKEPAKSTILNRYKLILELYEGQLAMAQTRQEACIARLIQLKK